MKAEAIKALTEPQRKVMIEHRRYLHQHPEPSFQEKNTADWIRGQLKALRIELKSGISGNSVVGILDTKRPGKTIAFRADIDAVAVQETTQLPYASVNPGAMHACGHDAHIAVLVSLAQILSRERDKLSGRVVFLFQQGEESFPGGACRLVEEGALDGVDHVFCFHASSIFALGDVNTSDGVRIGAVGKYDVKIHGQGGHGGTPHRTKNPIYAGAEMVSALLQLVPRQIDPNDTAVVTVSYFHGGERGVEAVIPAEAALGGMVCSLQDDVHHRLFSLIEKTVRGVAALHDCEVEYRCEYGYPAVVNSEYENSIVKEAVTALGHNLKVVAPSMAGDDFSYYLQEKPGAYFTVGMGDPDHPQDRTPHHSGGFVIDERGMQTALEIFLYIYFRITGQEENVR